MLISSVAMTPVTVPARSPVTVSSRPAELKLKSTRHAAAGSAATSEEGLEDLIWIDVPEIAAGSAAVFLEIVAGVVPRPLVFVGQDGISLVDLFELFLFFLALGLLGLGVSVRMMNQSSLPVPLFDLVIRCVFADSQHFVVVFSFRLFQFEFGVAQQLLVLSIAAVHLTQFLHVTNGFLVFAEILVGPESAKIRLLIVLVEFDGFGAVVGGRLEALELGVDHSPIVVQFGVGGFVVGIDLQRIGVDGKRRLPVGLFKGGVAFFLLRLKALGAAEAVPSLCMVGREAKDLIRGEKTKMVMFSKTNK